ncbi:DinB family protein [Streptosporangium sp. NPDC087985]|uniref:DinB family protein n=1 Tax=Streptosporangium sp. NPDC087985 TaxID=3366196 RepID=UPI0037FC2DC5
MTDNRVSPPFVGDERAMLNNWLDWHRETLAVKCAGLSEEQLRERAVPPSTLSLLGLVRHMAHVERAWFRHVLNDEDVPLLYKTADPNAEFNDVDTASAEEAFATWRAEVEHARRLSAEVPLDAIGKRQRHGQDCSHRWILVHMIEEYARHNGHADLLRERIDGVTGE